MKMHFKLILLLISGGTQAAIQCGLPPVIGGVQYCPASGHQTCAVDVEDADGVPQPRVFCLSIPSAERANAVFLFHGARHTGLAMAGRFANQASEAFLVLPSAGLVRGHRGWNTVDRTVPDFADLKAERGHSDTEFIQTLLLELDAALSCDQVNPPTPCILNYYAAGFSSGAGMVFQLYTRNEFNAWFSGYGAVSNQINRAMRAAHDPLTDAGNATLPLMPRPFFYMTGTEEFIHLPIDDMIDVVSSACTQPDDMLHSVYCYKAEAGNNIASGRHDSALWLREQNGALADSLNVWHDRPGNDTLISEQFYPADPLQLDSAPVALLTVINGAHSWPSIRNTRAAARHSEDIETSDEMVAFWRAWAGY